MFSSSYKSDYIFKDIIPLKLTLFNVNNVNVNNEKNMFFSTKIYTQFPPMKAEAGLCSE